MRIERGVVIVLFALTSVAWGENWPGWRGPRGDGTSLESGLPVHWDLSKNVRWKSEVPGVGHSSPIVWGNRVFLTTAVSSDPGQETFKKGLYFGGNRSQPDDAEYSWQVLCFDRDGGKLLWKQVAVRKKPDSPRHMKNSYASHTPVADGDRVYAFFGDAGLYCYDFAGRLVWSKNLGIFNMRYGWGTASSPILYRDRLILNCDQETGGSFIIALEKKSGKTIWKVDRDEVSSWSTPFMSTLGSRPELIVNATRAIRAYDPEDGKLLWECRGLSSSIAIPTPVAAHGLLFVSSGYVGDRVRPLVAFRPGGSGDLSLKESQNESEYIAWRQPAGGPYNPSPVAYGDHIFVIFDGGFIACFEARTGKEVYGKIRIEPGALFSASPVAVEGKLYCLSEDGDMYVIKAGPEYELLAKNSLDEVCMASPAVSAGKMFIRTFKHLYCIQ